MKVIPYSQFIFSARYRLWRHILYWSVHLLLWAGFWTFSQNTYLRNLFHMLLWLPVFIIYSYPIAYWAVPRLLLRGKLASFVVVILCWGVAGWFINYLFRTFIFIPVQEVLNLENIAKGGWVAGSFLCMTTSAGSTGILVLFKHWMLKQQQWMQAEKEKATAELQLLKAQVHPIIQTAL